MSCFVICVIVLHSYKIFLVLWYVAYHFCTYVATVSIEKCLSINAINVMGVHTRVREFDIVAACSTDGSELVHTFETVAAGVMSSVCYVIAYESMVTHRSWLFYIIEILVLPCMIRGW